MEEQQSTSTTLLEIEVCPVTELDIAAGIVYLKAYAEKHGRDAIPLEVELSPFAPEEGWRRASLKFCTENAKRRQRGEPTLLFGRPVGLKDIDTGPMMSAFNERAR